jgi:hypothetical protein
VKNAIIAAFAVRLAPSIGAIRQELSVVLRDSLCKALQGKIIRGAFALAGIWPISSSVTLLSSLPSPSAQEKQAYEHLLQERVRRKYFDITSKLLTTQEMIAECLRREAPDATTQPTPAAEHASEAESLPSEHGDDGVTIPILCLSFSRSSLFFCSPWLLC